jgi:hypothetical protein
MSSRTDGTGSNYRAAAGGRKRGGQIRLDCAQLGIPCGLMPNYGVKHNQQLAHARSKRDLRFLTSRA